MPIINHHIHLQSTKSLLFRIDGSVWPKVAFPVAIYTAYAFVIYSFGVLGLVPELGASSLISILSMVVAILVGYRTNSSSDRWHEGRRLFASIISNTRTSLRALKFGLQNNFDHDDAKSLINLVICFSYALKYHLRDNSSKLYETGPVEKRNSSKIPSDVLSLLPPAGVNQWNSMINNDELPDNLPLAVIDLIQAYVKNLVTMGRLNPAAASTIYSSLNSMTDIITSCERIRDTPIPIAYAIHLKQIVALYMLGIPIQIVSKVGVFVIPITAIASFTFFGVNAIGEEISDPFGSDKNDL